MQCSPGCARASPRANESHALRIGSFFFIFSFSSPLITYYSSLSCEDPPLFPASLSYCVRCGAPAWIYVGIGSIAWACKYYAVLRDRYLRDNRLAVAHILWASFTGYGAFFLPLGVSELQNAFHFGVSFFAFLAFLQLYVLEGTRATQYFSWACFVAMFAIAASVDAIEKEHGVPTELDAAASDVAREQRLAAFARLPGLRLRAFAFMAVEYAFFIGYAALTALVPPEAWVKARSSKAPKPTPRFSKAKAMERLMGPWIMAAMCAALTTGGATALLPLLVGLVDA